MGDEMRVNVALLLMAIGAVLVACGSETETQVKAAKLTLEASLRDPTTVQYRDVQAYSENVVCGEYNAKNGYGGYVGFKKFVVAGNMVSEEGPSFLSLCSNAAGKLDRLEDSNRKAANRISPQECAAAKDAAKGASAPSGGMTVEQLRAKVACGE